VFENSFCCNSLCAPSRASILTGTHSHVNGQTTLMNPFDGSQTTLPKLLQAAGYQTTIQGKWHLHSDPTGFDDWCVLPGQGNYFSTRFLTPDGEEEHPGGYSTDIIADKTINWLENRRDGDRPFFAMCHFKAPHRPWMPHPRYYGHFRDVEIPVPQTLFDDYANRCEVLKEQRMQISRDFSWDFDLKVFDPGPNESAYPFQHRSGPEWNEFDRMTPAQRAAWDEAYGAENEALRSRKLDREEMIHWAYQRYVKEYLRCVQGIDENVGRVLDSLDAQGLTDTTIVIYCSDQGFYLGEHGWYDKRWMFEESLRMPLLMRWPGKIDPGSTFSPLVQNIDYAPTLLQAAGLEVPDSMQGQSLLPVIEKGSAVHEDIYYHYYDKGHAVPMHDGVRTDRYKLIHFYTVGEFNLFDLETDPAEMRSLHEDPAYAEIYKEMLARYDRARTEYAVPQESE
jgi:N-acetylglucosamine-6-sulfatase